MAPELISILTEAEQEVPQELREMAERYNAMKEKRMQENRMANDMRRGYGGAGGSGGGRRSYDGNRQSHGRRY